jgi:hypothetical protein
MAEFTRTREIAERLVFRVPVPTVGVEVAKALNAATQEVRDRTSSTVYDDSLQVEVSDDEILIILDIKPWTQVRDE